MNAGLQLAVVLGLAAAGAGGTYWLQGPPDRAVVCDAAKLPDDEVCLERVTGEWGGQVVWVDARSRKDWERDGMAGSLLWNLDENEDMQAFEAAAAQRLFEAQAAGLRVVVYCTSEKCGTSRQVAERIRALQLGNEVFVLHGGWPALAAARLTGNGRR